MRLTYRQLEYLREVSRAQSIAGASRNLNISQSSILAAVEIAEEIIGTTLFHRKKGHGIAVTPAGTRFMTATHRFLSAGVEFEKALENFLEPTATQIRIGCFSPFGALLIPPVLKRFIAEQGATEVSLLEGDQVQLRGWLASGEVDLVLTYDIGEEYGSGITRICRFPPHALLHSADPLALREAVTIEELAVRPLVLLDLPETRSYLLSLFDTASVRPKIGLRTRSYETIRSAVANGLGVSVLNIRPNDATVRDSELVRRVPIADKLWQPTLLVADPYGDNKPGYVRHFIAHLHGFLESLGRNRFAVVPENYPDTLLYPLRGQRG